MDTTTLLPTPAFEFEEILNLLRVCFETAMVDYWDPSACVFEPLIYNSRTRADVSRVRSATSPPPQVMEHSTQHLRRFSKALLCNHFTFFMSHIVRDLLALQGFQVATRWVEFDPNRLLIFKFHDGDTECVSHSVLEISLEDGRIVYFDGTGEQFGWPSKSWLLEKDDYFNLHVSRENTHLKTNMSPTQYDELRKSIMETHKDIGGKMFGAMWDMFIQMDWQSLGRISPCKRVRHILTMTKELHKRHSG